jgi:hypothetical protein
VKNFLKRIRATSVELIEVASGLSKEQVSELINSEFEMEPIFAEEINAASDLSLGGAKRCLVLYPRLIILNPLSIIVTRLDCRLEALNAFENIVFYISTPFFSDSLEALHDKIKLSYNEVVKHGITKISLNNDLLIGKKRTLKIICNSAAIETDDNEKRSVLI